MESLDTLKKIHNLVIVGGKQGLKVSRNTGTTITMGQNG